MRRPGAISRSEVEVRPDVLIPDRYCVRETWWELSPRTGEKQMEWEWHGPFTLAEAQSYAETFKEDVK